MFQVYILKSDKLRRYYTGHTEDLIVRLNKHNGGFVRSTKGGVPWRVVHTEDFKTRAEAYRREMEIKGYKGGIKFKKLLGLSF
jgi:putative endonuclease